MENINGKKYVITVQPGEDCNPEFAPEKEMLEGIKVDGFVLIGFKDRKPHFESIMGVSVKDVSKWICGRERGVQIMRVACAIAEGEIRAMEIQEEKKGQDEGVTITGTLPSLSNELLRKLLGKD